MADPSADLFRAITNQDPERVQAILESGSVDVNKPYSTYAGGRDKSYLNTAVESLLIGRFTRADPRRGLKIVDLLLKAGADPNKITPFESSPLFIAQDDALYVPVFEVSKMLLEAGADPNRKSSERSQTILQKALFFSPQTIGPILLLLVFGANPSQTGGYDRETAIATAENRLREYIRIGRARELRFDGPSRDKTPDYQDIIDVLRLPKERYAELKPYIKRAVERGYLTEAQALYLLEKLDLHHNRRRHAVAAWRVKANAPPSNNGSAATGAGATRRGGGRRKRRSTRRRA